VSSSIVRSIASIRFAWPSRLFRQVGLFASSVLRHRQIDYNLWERLDKLEE